MKNTKGLRAGMAALLALASVVAVGAQGRQLSIEQAVTLALEASTEVKGAAADLQSAQAQALAARLRTIPSITLAGAYTHLSNTPATTLTIPPFPPFLTTPFSIDLPANFDNQADTGSLVLSVQYPVFAGFRLLEAVRIADLKTTSRTYAKEIIRHALAFEAQRAYWEVERANAGVTTLVKNREVANAVRQDVHAQVDQGLATESDAMTADQQYDQSELALADAVAQRDHAYLALASVLGQEEAGSGVYLAALASSDGDERLPYTLVSDPSRVPTWAAGPPRDPGRVVSDALANRPEAMLSSLSVQMAEHAVKSARSGLFPTLTLVGDYNYANPNNRILVSAFGLAPGFYGTWDVGVQVRFDVGAVPATVAQGQAAAGDLQKARADARKQTQAIIFDVRSSALSLGRSRRDLELTQGTVKQAEVNLRVQQDKQSSGLARRIDVLNAELALLRAQFAVTSREIDLQIAAADFARSTGLEVK